MREIIGEYGLLVISTIVVITVGSLLLRSNSFLQKEYGQFNPYQGISDENDVAKLNQVSDMLNNFIAPVIEFTNGNSLERTNQLPTGTYGNITTFLDSAAVENTFIPEDIQVSLGDAHYNKAQLIGISEFDLVLHVYELQSVTKTLKDKFGNPVCDATGNPIVEQVQDYVKTATYSNRDATVADIAQLTLNDNKSYKIIAIYRYNAPNHLKAENQQVYYRKGAVPSIKSPVRNP